jgi:predicted secreted protein
MKLFYALFLLMMAAGTASAQQNDIKLLEPGQTIISLSVIEQMELQQDLLQASLRIEIDDKDPKAIQNKINTDMQAALSTAKKYGDVKTSTGQYYVYSYDPNPQPQPAQNLRSANERLIWKGSQTINLNSKNSEQLLELAGKIQELGFVMNGLNYTLSPEKSEEYKDTLMTQALKKIQSRAALAAKSLGKSEFDIIEVSIDNAGPIMPMPMMMKSARMEAADAGMAAPVAQSGEQTVSMSVTARVLLRP